MIRILVLTMILVATVAYATAQFPDVIIIKGEQLSLLTNPLESYFGTGRERPAGMARKSCTAIWRGYVATWTVDEGRLMLVKLVEGTCERDAKEIPLETVFPGQKGPIPATWFTGTLRIAQGRLLKYVHMGYLSVYEKERLITVEAGRVTGDRVVERGDAGK